MIKKKLKVRLLYLGLHNQLIKKFGKDVIITRKEFFTKLGKHYMIPKNLRHGVILEMEEMKLIKMVNRDTLEVLDYDINIEEDVQKLSELVGLY